MSPDFFRKYIGQLFKFNSVFGIGLILIFGIPRFISVLSANKTGDYRFTSIIFIVMWLLPFLLLNKAGRSEIGIKKPKNSAYLLGGFLVGGLTCLLVWGLGVWLYGDSQSNWLVYISQTYQVPIGEENFNEIRFTYFIIFAITSMIFSPIGEELLYRGMIHRCFSEKMGDFKASLIDSTAFAVTHLAHFGILYIDGHWEFLWIPALLWMGLMFAASRVFFWAKQQTESILGAIIGHASFNLTMTYLIFYHIF